VAGGRLVGFDHVAAAMRMIEPDGPPSLDAPGQRLERIGASVVLRGRPPGIRGRGHPDPNSSASPAPPNRFRYPLSIPGEVELAETGFVVSAETEPRVVRPDETGASSGRGNVALVRGDLCHGVLAVRNRRPGDRFHPTGVAGRKKLQDFFVDRKVRRSDRDRVPIVVDEADRIVWVAGYGIDEAFQVTDPGQAVLTLRLRPMEALW
jgi:tRNA(Ile)-lysidine synthetase-like protein